MDSITVCEWDIKLGWVFIRVPEGQPTVPCWVVVQPQGGRAYLGTIMVAGQYRAVVKAPKTGVFEIVFHAQESGVEALKNNDRRASRVRFDASLFYDDSQPVGADHKVDFTAIALVREKDTVSAKVAPCEPMSPGDLPKEIVKQVIALFEEQPGLEGVTVAATVNERGSRGPCVDADLDRQQVMDVYFGEISESINGQPDWLVLKGFDKLKAPWVRVDLSRFGAQVGGLLPGFGFIHVPYNTGTRGLKLVRGKDLSPEVIKTDHNGSKYLDFTWQDGCHRDAFGVYFGGEPHLLPRDKSGQLQHTMSGSPVSAVLAVYLGSRYDLDSATLSEISERLEYEIPPIPLDDLQLQTSRSWAIQDSHVQSVAPDLVGAAQACPAFIFSYAALIREAARGVASAGAGRDDGLDWEAYRRELEQLGLDIASFDLYRLRADVVWAMQWHPALLKQMLDGFALMPTEEQGEEQFLAMSLPAYLVASLGEDHTEAAEWVDKDLSVLEQAMVWRYLEQGVSVLGLHKAKVRPDAQLPSPDDLIAALKVQEDPKKYERLKTVIEDTGGKLIDLQSPGLVITDLLNAGQMAVQAEAVLKRDLKTVKEAFESLNIRVRDQSDAEQTFDNYIAEHGNMPKRAELVRELNLLMQELHQSRGELPGLVSLRTRLGLLLTIDTLKILQELRKRSGPLLDWCERILKGGVMWIGGKMHRVRIRRHARHISCRPLSSFASVLCRNGEWCRLPCI